MNKGYDVVNLSDNITSYGGDINACPNIFMCECADLDILCNCPVDFGCGSPPEVECAPNYGACGTRSVTR